MPGVLSVSHSCYNPSSSALKLCYVSNMQIHTDLQVSFVFSNSTRTITQQRNPRQLMQQSLQFNNMKGICAAQWLLTSPMILITSDQCSTCQLRLSIKRWSNQHRIQCPPLLSYTVSMLFLNCRQTPEYSYSQKGGLHVYCSVEDIS